MMPSDVTDSQLARLVKEENSNEAMLEIITRHTGIYLSVVNSFNIPPLQKSDLLDSKNTNIYKYTLKYDESKGCKLSSYFHTLTYFDCLKTLEKSVDTEEITETNGFSESFTFNDEESVKQTSLSIARTVGGHEFAKVVEERHFNGEATKSWHKLNVGFSHEKARQIYKDNLDKYKVAMKDKFSYVKI